MGVEAFVISSEKESMVCKNSPSVCAYHPQSFVFHPSLPEKRRLMYECRCDERLKSKVEGSTRLTYAGLCGGLEHLKIETRLTGEMFEIVMGE